MTKLKPLLLLAVLLLLLLYPGTASADHHIKRIKKMTETDAKGEALSDTNEQSETWISKEKFRQNEGNHTTTIIRLDRKKLYHINHIERTFSALDLPLDLETSLPPDTRRIFQVMKMSSTVQKTTETQTIGQWASQKYMVNIAISLMGMSMPMKLELWVSKDTGINMKSFRQFYEALLSMNPFTTGLIDKFREIEGYPVLTVITMSVEGIKTHSREEVISIEEKKAPGGIYEIPEGYILIDYNPLDLGEGAN
jgi:hypothetical protein